MNAARRDGRPVIAVGTTVARALESAWDGERLRPAAGFTRLLVHPDRPAGSVDGIITGLHDPYTSHLAMLCAIAPAEMVRHGYAEAVREGYLWHEFGDSHLIAAGERIRRWPRYHPTGGRAMSSHKHTNEIGGPLALDWRASLADRWFGRTRGSGHRTRAPRRCRSRS